MNEHEENRPKWDDIWMQIAKVIRLRSIDPAYKIGCVIVSADNQQILAIGYNGMELGGKNEVDSLERGKSGTLHAELNALIKLDFSNKQPKRLYVTLSPCLMCARAIINAGITDVVYDETYRDTAGISLLNDRGINVRQHACGVT